jgi:hypothetical protein
VYFKWQSNNFLLFSPNSSSLRAGFKPFIASFINDFFSALKVVVLGGLLENGTVLQ